MRYTQKQIRYGVVAAVFLASAGARAATPIDYGPGPGLPKPASPVASGIPHGGPAGAFGAPRTWPIIAIHAALLNDGRVMNFGTSEAGDQGGQLVYDVWSPASDDHNVLPNTTGTDIFCAGQSVIPGGEVLITGGDATINGVRNFSNARTTLFSPATNSIRSDSSMAYQRWYATNVPLASGAVFVAGGRENKTPLPAVAPEVYTPGSGWQLIPGAGNDDVFGTVESNWYYPRAWLTANGQIFVLGNSGATFSVNMAGGGSVTPLTVTAPYGNHILPAVMYAQNRILSLRSGNKNAVINLGTTPPKITVTANRDSPRFWSTSTVLPDGNVLVTGGSAANNQLSGVAYTAITWHPATGQWTTGATAAKPRLYHSTALLLPDGSVLVAGGGAPGPVRNLNAEIYYPGYLYGANGSPAPRPVLAGADPVVLVLSGKFAATMGSAGAVSKLTMVRAGAVTHSFDAGQRFFPLNFVQTGSTLNVTLPSTNRNVIPPGYYLLFAFNAAGVPSVAKTLNVR